MKDEQVPPNEHLARLALLAGMLFRDGSSEQNLQFVEGMPAVQTDFQDDTEGDLEADEAKSDQFADLDRDVYLRQSVFVDSSDRPMLERNLSGMYAAIGMIRPDFPIDHLAAQLFYFSILLESLPEQCEPFATEHLLAWFPPAYDAICRQNDKVDRVGMVLCVEILNHFVTDSAVVEDADLVDRQSADVTLKSVVEELAEPSSCGMFLHRDDLVMIGRRNDIPLGFGSRKEMLRGLLEGAVRYGKLDGVKEGIADLLLEAVDRYAELDERIGRRAAQNVWLPRVALMLSRLSRLEDA